MRGYLGAFLYLLSLSFAQNAFLGRSGQISLESTKTSTTRMVLLDEMDGIEFEEVQYPIDDINVANLVSHLVGVVPANNINDRETFPAGSLFRKAKANILFTLDTPSLSCPMMGQGYVVRTRANDAVSFLTNIATGTLPSDHGIVGRTWMEADGTIATAFTGAADSYKPNMADLVTSSFARQSMTLSYSADEVRARIFAPNSVNAGDATYVANTAGVLGRPTLFKDAFAPRTLSLPELDLADNVYNYHGALFDLSDPAVAAFFTELSTAQGIVEALSGNARVTDDVPDTYYFAFSTISALPAQLQKPASDITVAFIKTAYARFQELYGGRAVAQILQESKEVEIPEELISSVLSAVGSATSVNFAPQIYTKRIPSKAVCSRVEQLASEYEFTAVCAGRLVFRRDGFLGNSSSDSSSSSSSSSGGSVSPTDDSSAFTIFLWISIFMVLFALGGIYCLCGVGFEMTSDSMLYRQTRRHAHQE